MVERGLGGNDADLAHRLEAFRRDRSRRASDMRKLAAGWARMASALVVRRQEPREDMSIARLLALAFPERIGKARGAPGQFLLANGRGANLDATHPLARSPFLVAAELSGSAAVDAHPARRRCRRSGHSRRRRPSHPRDGRDRIRSDRGRAEVAPCAPARCDPARERAARRAGERRDRAPAGGRDREARAEPPAVEQGANPAARPRWFPARGRRGRMAGPDRRRRSPRRPRSGLPHSLPARPSSPRSAPTISARRSMRCCRGT